MNRQNNYEPRCKASERLNCFFLEAGAICIGIIVIMLFFCGEYPERLADNKLLMLFVLFFFLAGGFLYWITYRKKTKHKILRHPVLLLAGAYVLLYSVQLLWVNKVYFYSGWEVFNMRNCVEWLVNGGSLQGFSIDVKYSIFPNNLLLFYLFCIIEKLGMMFSMETPYNLCIYISCLCVNLSCFLGNLIMRRLTDSGMIKCLYTIISTVFILFSPWIIIPYSDTYGMLFVMLGVWGLICVDQNCLKWMITAFAAAVGYHIKPTCIFPLFAAYIVYGLSYILKLRERRKEMCALLLGTLVFVCVWLFVPWWIQHTYSFQLLPHCRMTYTHFLMMGINEETSGTFSTADFMYSNGFPNVETREQANKEEFVRRLNELWDNKRLGKFIKNKALVNFNDGTFAWNGEGGFFYISAPHENILWEWFLDTMIPPNTWENKGTYYYLYRTAMQTLWLLILTGITLTAFDQKNNLAGKNCLMIVLCGLMVFVMVFEARARYLFLYSPAFLLLSLCGYEAVWKKSIKKVQPTGGSHEITDCGG